MPKIKGLINLFNKIIRNLQFCQNKNLDKQIKRLKKASLLFLD